MRLSSSTFRLPLRFAALSIAVLSAVTAFQPAGAQETGQAAGPQQTVAGSTQHAISLVPLTDQELAAQSLSTGAKTPATTAANFREFASVQAGQVVEAKPLTLHFARAAKVTRIKSTSDFTVEQGGSCVEGNSYAANATCTLMMRFTPQGPGWRLGKVQITNSADLTPFYVGLGGYGAAPAISFTPSIINTVAGTSVSGVGIFSGATNLAVDGGDSVYIADTGNNRVESISPTGTLQNMTSSFGATAPIGVAVDHNGFLYFTQRAQYFFLNILPSPNTETYYSSGSNSCAVGSTCPLNGTSIAYSYLGALTTDPNGNVFLNTFESAARLVPSPSIFAEDYIPLDTPYNYDSDAYTSPQSLAVDSSDTLYTYYNDGSGAECEISGESYYSAYSNVFNAVKVAGGVCGFSGDGGQARAAQISRQLGQMAFDIAGNLYFTDTLNQRIRRIDNLTGVITTVAGNGVIGNGGDYGPATSRDADQPDRGGCRFPGADLHSQFFSHDGRLAVAA